MNFKAVSAMIILAIQLDGPLVKAQTKPAIDLEGAIAREQVDGDLKAASVAYQKIAADRSVPRDVRARALLHLAGCNEKLGQQARSIYEQIVHDFGDQRAAVQARARLAAYSPGVSATKELKPQRLTANTSELIIQAAGISRDGKFIAYSDQLGIHVRETTSGRTRLLAGTQHQVFVQWTSDMKGVQTQMPDNSGGLTTSLVPLDSSDPATVATSNIFVSSPDGIRRAVVSSDQRQMVIQEANGTKSREIWRATGARILDQFQWSPDGRLIAVLSSEHAGNAYRGLARLEIVQVSGRGRITVLVPEERKLDITSLVWPSLRRLIVVINKDTGPNQYESNLWELRLDEQNALLAGGLRKLTAWMDFPIRSGSLSTDGKRLIFIRSVRQRDVYVAPLEAGGARMGLPRRLTLDLGDDYPSDWTRDSKTVILTSTRSGLQTIFRQDLDQPIAEQIVFTPGRQALARVTPDGNSVLFMNRHPNNNQANELMLAPIRGGPPEPVPNSPNPGWYYRCAAAGVCLNAKKEDSGEFVISELDLKKGQGREIYRDSHMEHPDISPDGNWIADTSGRGKDAKITLRSFSSGAVVREIPVGGVTELITFGYAPDGKGFFCGDSSAAEVRELYIDISGNVAILYREPASDWGIWGIPSPDGKYLALVLFTDDSNVYMVEGF